MSQVFYITIERGLRIVFMVSGGREILCINSCFWMLLVSVPRREEWVLVPLCGPGVEATWDSGGGSVSSTPEEKTPNQRTWVSRGKSSAPSF